MRRRTAAAALTCALMLATSGCHTIDDDRIPPTAVYVPFSTIGEWQVYGVGGALDYRYFIKPDRQPSGFPYTQLTQTGYGGVLLACDVNGIAVAYDMACPVECRADVRIRVVKGETYAECPVCHSTYSIFATPYGYPLAGRAAEMGWGLQTYAVAPGSMGEYMCIRR